MKLRREHKLFIDEYLKDGDKVRAYKVAYPKASHHTALTNSLRLLNHAGIAAVIKQESEKIEALTKNKLVIDLKDSRQYKVLSLLQKREILCQIALGEIEIEMKKVVFDPVTRKFSTVTVIGRPDYNERLKAIDMDNKMTGAYAPVKMEFSGEDGGPVQHEHKHVVVFENYREQKNE